MSRCIRIAAALIPLIAASFAYGAGPTIAGSKHDFSQPDSILFQASGGEICKPCHTPHNAVDVTVSDRLWAHTLSTASYTVHAGRNYTTGALDIGQSASQTEMDRQSRLCLSCHDGTVALDAFAGKMADAQWGDSTANLGSDLLNDHPVGGKTKYDTSKPYYKALADPAKGTVTILGTSGTLPLVKANNGTDWSISCLTCHNAHGAGYSSLLRGDNAGSNLCLSCHNK
jgi:predicted CXXCH cytochrome family protein